MQLYYIMPSATAEKRSKNTYRGIRDQHRTLWHTRICLLVSTNPHWRAPSHENRGWSLRRSPGNQGAGRSGEVQRELELAALALGNTTGLILIFQKHYKTINCGIIPDLWTCKYSLTHLSILSWRDGIYTRYLNCIKCFKARHVEYLTSKEFVHRW